MMKWLTIISAFLILYSCSNDDDKDAPNETDISIVTGINLRASEFSAPVRLGNPNTFTNSRFLVYPNPSFGMVKVISEESISDVFLIPANASTNYQAVNFSSIFSPDFYSESSIINNADFELFDQNSTDLELNFENIRDGHYRLVTVINGGIYWDNIYISSSGDIDELMDFWE